jgi:hypothetical protein
MTQDLSTVLSLRRVLESAESGMGMTRSLVRELTAEGGPCVDVARMLLLGHTLAVALRPLVEDGSEEVAMLASLIVSTTGSSTTLVGRSGEELARTLERWLKVKESRRLEQRVLRFRSLITSGVLGAVTAMVATLGPLVGSLSFAGPAVQGAAGVLPAAAVMTALSSGMLGLFMSGRRMFVNVIVAMAAFAAVSAIASPLASVPLVPLWGVK